MFYFSSNTIEPKGHFINHSEVMLSIVHLMLINLNVILLLPFRALTWCNINSL